MATPSLNSIVGYEHILTVLKLAAFESNPVSARCPLCSTGCISAIPEHELGGYWWFCDSCNFNGTSILLYQVARNHSDLRAAWLELKQEAEIRVPPALDNEETIDAYRTWEDQRAYIESIIENSKTFLSRELPSKTVKVLRSLNSWGGWTSKTMGRSLGQLVGSANQGRLLGLSKNGGVNIKGCKNGYHNSLLVPYEELPGKTSKVLLVPSTTKEPKLLATSSSGEGGILGYNASLSHPDRIVALTSTEDVLSLQKNYLKDSDIVGPFIGYFNGTNSPDGSKSYLSLQKLPHDKVIFWGYGDDLCPETVDSARNLFDTAYIASKPILPSNEEVSVAARYSPQMFIKLLDNNSEYWLDSLKTHLISQSPPDAQKFLSFLSTPLNSTEVDALKQRCGQKELTQIQSILNQASKVKIFPYGNKQIIEREGLGWYEVNTSATSGRVENRISDATIRLEEAAVVKGEPYYTGWVFCGEKSERFTVSEGQIRKDPGKWLTGFCIENNLGVPHIEENYRKHLLNLAKASHTPVISDQLSKVGWYSMEEKWVFPSFEVSSNGIKTTNSQISQLQEFPGKTLRAVESITPAKLKLLTTQENQIPLALTFAVVSNLVSSALKGTKSGIALINSDITHTRVLIKSIAEKWDLPIYKVESLTSSLLKEISSQENRDDLPVALTRPGLNSKNWQTWLQFYHPRNCILSPEDQKVASNLVTTGDWIFIDCHGLETVNFDKNLEYLDYVISFTLSNIIKKDFTSIQSSDSVPRECGQEFYKATLAVLGGQAENIKDSINRIHTSPVNSWNRFLWSVFYSIVNGFVDVTPPNKHKNVPISYRSDGSIFVRWGALRKKLSSKKILLPDPELIDEAIRDHEAIQMIEDGWVIPRAVWNQTFFEWKSIFRVE